MSLSLFKTGAIAATALMISAGAALAAPHGYIAYDTKVKSNHSSSSTTLQWAYEDQYVTILNSWGNWFYVKLPGPDGWVKKSAVDVDFGPGPGPGPGPFPPGPGPGPGPSVCFNGPFGYFCVN